MQTSVINKSSLERTLRIDGEYYQKKYLSIEKKMFSFCNIKAITDLCIVSDGNHMSIAKYFTSEQGIPYYRGQNLTDFFLENASPIFIPENIYESTFIKRSHFKVGDVLLSIVGTVGNLSLITKNIKKSTGSCKIAILRPKNIHSEYLAAFLMSKYGGEQIKRNTRGAVQTGLILEDFSQIYVVIPSDNFQQKIVDIITLSLRKNKQSKELYSRAEQLLLSKLNLLNWKPKHRLSFIKNYTDTISASRIDSEYFQPMYDEIINRAKEKSNIFFVRDIFNFKRGNFIDTKYYSKEKTNRAYIRIKELSNTRTVDETQVVYINDDFKNDSINTLKENDIVMAIIGDTIGKSNLILKEYEGNFFSNNTGRFRLRPNFNKKFNPFYLETLFHSLYIQSQIQRAKAQTGQPKISDNEINKILIPCISLGTQNKIGQSISRGIESRKISKRLLNISKLGVEIAIEKGENIAENWIKSEINKLGIDVNI